MNANDCPHQGMGWPTLDEGRDEKIQALAATETTFTQDGKSWVEHICGACPHGLLKGYALPHASHPSQRLMSHHTIDTLRCESEHPNLVRAAT